MDIGKIRELFEIIKQSGCMNCKLDMPDFKFECSFNKFEVNGGSLVKLPEQPSDPIIAQFEEEQRKMMAEAARLDSMLGSS